MLSMANESDRCAQLAFDYFPRLRGTVSGANVVSGGLGCATDMKPDAPRRAELIETLERGTQETLADKSIPLSGDDRSGLYDSLVSAREAAKDDAGALKLRQEWAAFLEGEAARAKTPEQRLSPFELQRMNMANHLYLHRKNMPQSLKYKAALWWGMTGTFILNVGKSVETRDRGYATGMIAGAWDQVTRRKRVQA